MHPATNEAVTVGVPSQPATGGPRGRPKATRRTKPASGNRGRYVAAFTMAVSGLPSSAQHMDVVRGRARTSSEDGHHKPKAHDLLGRGNHEDEEHERLAPDVVEHAGE